MIVPRRIYMRSVVGGNFNGLDRPAFAIGQLLFSQAGKVARNIACRLTMRTIPDGYFLLRRVGGYIVLERYRNIDQS